MRALDYLPGPKNDVIPRDFCGLELGMVSLYSAVSNAFLLSEISFRTNAEDPNERYDTLRPVYTGRGCGPKNLVGLSKFGQD